MLARLNLTIDEELLKKVKVYAEHNQSGVPHLVEEYFKTLISQPKKKSIIDIIEELPKPKLDFPKDLDLKEEYYEQNRKKFGF